MGLHDHTNPEGNRLQVELIKTDSDELIVNPQEDIKWGRHPIKIIEGEDKIDQEVPDHRVLIELTGYSKARIISLFEINDEL
jgi:hypothetical protein